MNQLRHERGWGVTYRIEQTSSSLQKDGQAAHLSQWCKHTSDVTAREHSRTEGRTHTDAHTWWVEGDTCAGSPLGVEALWTELSAECTEFTYRESCCVSHLREWLGENEEEPPLPIGLKHQPHTEREAETGPRTQREALHSLVQKRRALSVYLEGISGYQMVRCGAYR